MVNVLLIQSITSGFPGAPGYTTFAFEHENPVPAVEQFEDVLAFWNACKGSFPTTWSVLMASEHRVVDEVTGALVDIIPRAGTGSSTPIAGTSGTTYGANIAGAVLSWRTLTNNRGRRVRGRTFLVPMRAAAYAADGSLVDTLPTDLALNGTTTLVTPENDFGIWSRPRAGTGGKFAGVVGVSCPDRVSYLRSRRD